MVESRLPLLVKVAAVSLTGIGSYAYYWWRRHDVQDAIGAWLANDLVRQVDGPTERRFRDVDREGNTVEDYGESDEEVVGTPYGPATKAAAMAAAQTEANPFYGPPTEEQAKRSVSPPVEDDDDDRKVHKPAEFQHWAGTNGEGRVNRLIITYSRLAKIERGTPQRTPANVLSVRRLILKAMKRNCVRECDQILVIEAAVEAVFVPNREEVRVARLVNSWGVYWRKWMYRSEAGTPSN
jgi:hypothetical protein